MSEIMESHAVDPKFLYYSLEVLLNSDMSEILSELIGKHKIH